jgi:eukaryotic-like serine/threonine-protein kinase
VILYQLLAGRQPFAAKTAVELRQQIVHEQPPPLEQFCPGLEPALAAICRKCLDREPGRRYATAGALADDLGRWQRSGPRWTRPWRLARRRPLSATAVVLVVGAAVTATVLGLRPADPERPLHALENALTRAQPVVLIGPEGPPAWSRWKDGEATAQVVPARDRTFTLATWSAAVLELAPDPHSEAFRLSADVKQHDGKGGVGLYFGESTSDTATAPVRFLADWTMAEGADGPTRIRFNLRYCRFAPLAEGGEPDANGTFGCIEQEDSHPGFGTWRRLALEVTPREIRVFWQGQQVGQPLSRETLGEKFEHWKATRAFHSLGLAPGTPEPLFTARQGLGLYIQQCSASFRNVQLEPLDP